MIRILILLVFLGAGCAQQEEPETIIEGGIGKSALSYTEDGIKYVAVGTEWVAQPPKFDPTKHYIISVDTVGFEKQRVVIWDSTFKAGDNAAYERYTRSDKYETRSYWGTTDWGIIRWGSSWVPTLDTTWAPKEHLLVTPEEAKKLRKLIK